MLEVAAFWLVFVVKQNSLLVSENQSRRELGGVPGQNLGKTCPYFKIFSGKNFGTLPKKPNILPFARKYFTQKMTGAQQNISRGPKNLGARGNSPPLAPLLAALVKI
jgi:hypothetical protein